MQPRATISCDNIWKLYGKNPQGFFAAHDGNPDAQTIKDAGYISAVRAATFEVYAGEILVVMGLSGSGKSTLVRCLSRLIEPTHGKIMLDGEDLLRLDAKQLIDIRRHKMGMVFQHFALLPHRTVLDNIAFPLEVRGEARDAREKKAREIIQIVGLEGREDYYPRELSGGQQQRVGLARSLCVDPEIWFLDEPFSALDPLIRKELQNEFLRLRKVLSQRSIVFITHDFDEAIKLADRIAIMNAGEIVQIGTAEQLIANPANDYVAEFTKDVPRAKLLRVGGVMRAPAENMHPDITLHTDDLLSQIAGKVMQQDRAVRVVDADNQVVGSLSREQLISLLF